MSFTETEYFGQRFVEIGDAKKCWQSLKSKDHCIAAIKTSQWSKRECGDIVMQQLTMLLFPPSYESETIIDTIAVCVLQLFQKMKTVCLSRSVSLWK